VAKVLSLFSGSLASRVATRIVEQHPDVDCVYLLHFRSPFSREFEGLRQLVRAEWPHTIFRTQSIKKEYRRLVEVTDDGEFSLPLSCYNCRKLLFAKAARYMERIGAEYIVSGEIPGRSSPGTSASRQRILSPPAIGAN
jgi:adenylyl- and sulfurtransferase ThiI